jgi:hypothetical protein
MKPSIWLPQGALTGVWLGDSCYKSNIQFNYKGCVFITMEQLVIIKYEFWCKMTLFLWYY